MPSRPRLGLRHFGARSLFSLLMRLCKLLNEHFVFVIIFVVSPPKLALFWLSAAVIANRRIPAHDVELALPVCRGFALLDLACTCLVLFAMIHTTFVALGNEHAHMFCLRACRFVPHFATATLIW